ncbi:MAG TPA: hypothetical protein VK387_02075 [Thermoleophilaceae bacterium]|nr:hypothetical protein [Thermoleophilaceae bacterium]
MAASPTTIGLAPEGPYSQRSSYTHSDAPRSAQREWRTSAGREPNIFGMLESRAAV